MGFLSNYNNCRLAILLILSWRVEMIISIRFKLLLFRKYSRFLSNFFLALCNCDGFNIFICCIKWMERKKLLWIEMIFSFTIVNKFLGRSYCEISWRIDCLVMNRFQIDKAFLNYILGWLQSLLRIASFFEHIIKCLKVLLNKLSTYFLINLL